MDGDEAEDQGRDALAGLGCAAEGSGGHGASQRRTAREVLQSGETAAEVVVVCPDSLRLGMGRGIMIAGPGHT